MILKELWLSTWYVFRFSNDDIYPFLTMYFINKVLILLCFFYLLLSWIRLKPSSYMHIYGDHADNLELPTYASTEQTDDTYTKAPTVRIKVGIKHVSNLCDLHSPDKKQNDNNQRGPKRRDFPESEITQIENVCETTAETPNTLLENYDNNGYDVRF